MPATIFSVRDVVGRVVDSLLRGECRGVFLCARCLVGALTSTCVACASRTMPCLGVPSP